MLVLKFDYVNASEEARPNYINMDQISCIAPCTGKKKDEDGYESVMYTGNGHAYYSKLTPDELTIACQGAVITEDQVRTQVAQVIEEQMQQLKAKESEDEQDQAVS